MMPFERGLRIDIDRRADRTGNINAAMHGARAAERIGTDAEARRKRDMIDRLKRRDRNHGLLECIELLPGQKQFVELGIGIGARFFGIVAGGFIGPAHAADPYFGVFSALF